MPKNPFAINFGIVPSQYINRDLIVDEILQELEADEIQNPCFMLTGTRGSGKTVTMTTIEQRLKESPDWCIVRLNPARDMLSGLVAKLYDSNEFVMKFVNKSLNLSKFGIGISVTSQPPVADIESALEIILKEIKRKKKRLLVTVDEVSKTEFMQVFAGSFQIMLREGLPICLLMAGLYENIRNLENVENLTFLYRTPRYEMEPLNLTRIAEKYRNTMHISQEEAMKMAILTKGYPFAYQALGKYLWEENSHKLSKSVLQKYDEALRHYVYEKIWSELSPKDRRYMSFITKKEQITTAELLKLSGQAKNEFSQYRARLRDKGLIDVSKRGIISFRLPRFDVFVENTEY